MVRKIKILLHILYIIFICQHRTTFNATNKDTYDEIGQR